MTRVAATRTLENVLRKLGFNRVCGVDEVGRGCLAGPVVAGAVVLHPDRHIPWLSDSKTVPAAEREASVRADHRARARVGGRRGLAGRDRHDQHPSGVAAGDAARGHVARAAARSRAGRRVPHPGPADGAAGRRARRPAVLGDCGGVDRRQGDARPADAATCTRRIPRYGFDRHKGYATADHLAAVRQFGYSAVHRRSFSPPDAAAGI